MEKIKIFFNKAKIFYLKYERVFLPVSFFLGMVWDNFTLQRIDLLYENAVFVWNIFLSGFVIVLFNAFDAGRLQGKIWDKILPFSPILLQFAFGNLFSGFIIFYTRGGSVLASWPFLLFLAVLFFGNDFFRRHYVRLTFQVGVFFIAVFSYSVFVLPILLKAMGAHIFLLSGLMALLIIGLGMFGLFLAMKERFLLNLKPLLFCIGGIYIIFNILYFTNAIPPLPLSIKESGVYHSIEPANQENYLYKVSFERPPSYLFFKEQSDNFSWTPDSGIYFYSAVFSPVSLNVKILHRWLFFDEAKGDWVLRSEVLLPTVLGGRDGGYRTYSYITTAQPGKWRVDVVNERGQVLGRRNFTVTEAEIVADLETAFR